MENITRLKSFDVPHKALRNAISQLSLLAGNTDYLNAEEVKQLYTLGREVFTMLTVHAHDEDNVTLRDLEAKLPGSSAQNMNEHVEIEEKQAQLEKLLEQIQTLSAEGKNPTAQGAEFYAGLSKFYSAYLLHMNGEETTTQQLLWQYFTDEELMGHRGEIMKKMPPETLMLWIKYGVPAQSFAERTGFMKGFKMMAPAPFFDAVMVMLEKHLAPADMHKLRTVLN